MNNELCAQKVNSKSLLDSLTAIKVGNLPASGKLGKYYLLKYTFEKTNIPFDSVYAQILHLIGYYECAAHKDYNKAIYYSLASININTSKAKNCSPRFALNSYCNIAFYYEAINLYTKSLLYFDSVIINADNLKEKFNVAGISLVANLEKAFIYFRQGDYQKSIDESTKGINASLLQHDSLSYLKFLNQQSQAFFHQGQTEKCLEDVSTAIDLAIKIKEPFQLANVYRMKAIFYASISNFDVAENSFKKLIVQRLLTNDNGQIAEDYNDVGNFYSNDVKNFKQAEKNYFKGIQFALKNNDSLRLARIYCDLGNTYFKDNRFDQAQIFSTKAFDYLKLNTSTFFSNPNSGKTDLVGDKELLIYLFNNKTELLLNQYLVNRNKKYLIACLNTAIITDSIINKTRHEQLGEQSKLYWRNNTRDFYNNAIKASCLASDARLAFFFMEKSRAVLLNDKLNELGASAHLPISEAEKEDSLRENIVLLEQQLVDVKEGTKIYEDQQMKLLKAKENWQKYTQSLEQKYPAYYQYKYDDKVPDLPSLQKYLSKNDQAFIHYFITDSVIYILGVTPTSTQLIKVSKNEFNSSQLSTFLKMCADRQAQNAHYNDFINLSNLIYSALFQPLQIKQKRVIVCADNFLIPFGALSVDKTGEHFLIQDHAFSYAYSACSLLKSFNTPAPKGDLLGIAPVDFASHLQLPSLKKSGESLKDASKAFNNVKLLRNNDATKYSFIKLLPNYSVVNVFSHASVDSAGEEPVLFMADSVIHLSELQNIKTPATNLVILSACQTNVGKLETGEGVYSLARGFASSGIQSVAATLWKADEDAIYEITKLFDQKLEQGMRKDDALQEAELAYMKHGNGKELPYFWANMVLVGNGDPVKLSSPNHTVLIVFFAAIVLLLITFILIRKSRSKIT